MAHYDCKGCGAGPYDPHSSDCRRGGYELTRSDLTEGSITSPPCKCVHGCVSHLQCLNNRGCLSLDPIDRPEKTDVTNSLPEDAQKRLEYPMADGFLDYFPNAVAEVSRLSYAATKQHHPDQPMHWDRSKSTDHRNKIMRHLVDAGGVDDKGMRHSAMVAWRALALLQEELERDEGLPPSKASRNRPF